MPSPCNRPVKITVRTTGLCKSAADKPPWLSLSSSSATKSPRLTVKDWRQRPRHLVNVFFLLFLFGLGYGVGPQFFRGMKSDGLPQVIFAVVICVICLLVTWGTAVGFGFDAGNAWKPAVRAGRLLPR